MLVIEGAIRGSMNLNNELILLTDRYYKYYTNRVLK